jgi:hypothetical protein
MYNNFKFSIEFEVSMKQVTLIKMCLNETYSEVHIVKNLSDNFPIQNGLKEEMFYCHMYAHLPRNSSPSHH